MASLGTIDSTINSFYERHMNILAPLGTLVAASFFLTPAVGVGGAIVHVLLMRRGGGGN